MCACEQNKVVLMAHSYAAGLAAADALRKHVGSAPVRCDVKNRDQYNRAVAVCYRNGDEDLNEWMAANGQAVAYTEYSKDYAASADVARRKKAVRPMQAGNARACCSAQAFCALRGRH